MKRLVSLSGSKKLKTTVFKSIIILKELGLWVSKVQSDGKLDGITELTFNKISIIIGGYERIAGTPIPHIYSIVLNHTASIYRFLLHFYLDKVYCRLCLFLLSL
jgi:putative membrane protein